MNGIGEIDGTVALDCYRSVTLGNESLFPIDGTCTDGSTIRCEERGNKVVYRCGLVASSDQLDNVALLPLEAAVGGNINCPKYKTVWYVQKTVPYNSKKTLIHS
jgi:hypothetical protein